MMKSTIATFMIATIFTSTVFCSVSAAENTAVTVEQQQHNAINMLNYMSELSYEASESKNRIRLEELYSALTNNTRPNAVDTQTLDEVLSLLDTLEGYRMTSVKRDRIQYIYEQRQAQAFRDAMPNPVGLLSLTRAYSNPKKLLSVLYMAVDSVNNYQSSKSEAEMERLMQNWELDDEESKILNNSRKDLFAYMVSMVNSYGLDDSLSLNEDSVEDFVKWKNNDSVLRKIQFFESKQNIYQAFGPYWLELASCYYENEDYEKCLKALETYESLNIDIYRMDYALSRTLPMVIIAANEVLNEKDYVEFADKYAQKILDNTKDSQWDLKYFVAETFVDLYNRTDETDYLDRAYTVALNNSNYLFDQQAEMNKMYLSEVEKIAYPDGATKAQKKEVDEYNKYLKEVREKELPPVSDALLLNIDMLYSVAQELDVSDTEKKRIDALFKDENGVLFLTVPYDQLYSFEENKITEIEDVTFDDDEVMIPAKFATQNTSITVEVNGEEQAVFTDWILDKVKRDEESDLDSYVAIYTSEEADKFDYVGDEKVTVTIQPLAENDTDKQSFQFEAIREKAIGVLDSFEWLDDASKWSDSISFERID